MPITLQWEDESTFDFCFRDVPKNSVVSISTVGVANKHMDSSERKMFLKGFNEAMIQLTPREVMHYGALLPECNYGNTKFVVYPNSHFLIDQFQFNKETANG